MKDVLLVVQDHHQVEAFRPLMREGVDVTSPHTAMRASSSPPDSPILGWSEQVARSLPPGCQIERV